MRPCSIRLINMPKLGENTHARKHTSSFLLPYATLSLGMKQAIKQIYSEYSKCLYNVQAGHVRTYLCTSVHI